MQEEGKGRRRKKKKKKKPLPSQDRLFFSFLIFTRACACGACAPLVPSIRTRSWMFNKEIKCLNSHKKKQKTKKKYIQKSKNKKREKERKKIQNKQTNKAQPTSTSNQPAQATRVCHPGGGSLARGGGVAGGIVRGTEAETPQEPPGRRRRRPGRRARPRAPRAAGAGAPEVGLERS